MPNSGPPHILYIDDDPGIGRLVSNELRRHNINATVAQSGAQGLRLATETAFDVVGLDHFMPGENGLEILAALNRLPNSPAVIYVTGSEDINIAVAALKAGASDFVVKDVHGSFLTLLRKAIDSAVMQSQLRRAKEKAEAEILSANERLEKLAAKQAILLHEMNHRIGNSLQLITSMIRLQASATHDPHAKSVLRQAAERVIAVAQVHQRLYTSDDIQFVEMQPYLGKLLEDQQLAAKDRGCELSAEIDDVKLSTDRAISVGIIVTELVTNSLKYAYPDAGGPIRVILAPTHDDALSLAVEDDGVGHVSAADDRSEAQGTGVGSRIVDAMAKSLGAQLAQDSDSNGFRSVLVFPRGTDRPAGVSSH
nr:response regulator [uncultured Dongia sp.]